ncbi:MAG: cobyrinic acid a,c-diamide synthase [Sciscionella sp.]
MSRRASLPGAAELFRSTGAQQPRDQPAETVPGAEPAEQGDGAASDTRAEGVSTHRRTQVAQPRAGSARQKHTTKITVYLADQELLEIEQARLALRAAHGLAVDRGRIVREAIAVLLADFEQQAGDSVLVRRLTEGSDR